ncbi:thiol reductant ABC exporter subunit CydC [Cellulomonas hominis]|uniref:thiol reductant ABC exporter subunit CydC n=1 Tax=Cellulomonas hominis TaxID=156981 RepID=UPI001B9FF085|nr:thiol reductant ABC exporter subunit CydC [Cellulomonas hominis]VTR78877.1 putative ABC transporter ATP-binding protein [Cellulomonas hominis]
MSTAAPAAPLAPAAQAAPGTPPAPLSRAAVSRRLVRFGRPVLAPLAASLVCRVAGQLLGIALLGVSAWGVARVAQDPAALVAPVVWTLVVLSLVKGVLRYLEQFTGHAVAFKALAMLRVDFYDRLAPQSPAGVLSRRTGDLVNRATKDVDRVEVFFAHTLVPAVSAVVVPAVVLVVLAVGYDPVLALVLLPFLVLVGAVVPGWGRTPSAAAATHVRAARGRLAQLVTESLQGVREVLASGAAGRRRAEARAVSAEVHAGLGTLATWTARRRAANSVLMVGAVVTVALVGAARVSSGALGWPAYAVAVVLALAVFTPVLAVEDVAPDLEQAFAAARRLWRVTDAAPATTSPAHPVPVPAGPLDIRFEGVSFTYPAPEVDPDDPASAAPPRDRRPVLHGLDLHVPAGGTTAVVGSSGSGKSTLVNLLTRAWDPDAGRVLLGGVDVRDVALEDLRRHVAVVGQSTYLFNDTLAANLRLAAPDATDEQLVEACRRAALHDAVLAMPDGYDTRVGEMGERLSGGQRQRVAIARALLLDAPVLVLDEATSQLDVATEAEIQDALVEVCRGRTVLVIAHRPGAVRTADRVLRIDDLSRA